MDGKHVKPRLIVSHIITIRSSLPKEGSTVSAERVVFPVFSFPYCKYSIRNKDIELRDQFLCVWLCDIELRDQFLCIWFCDID